jgi:uncharacterized protein (DUF1684 family)
MAERGRQAVELAVDLNFLYRPSYRYDEHWMCPLAPSDNIIDTPIRVGERLSP